MHAEFARGVASRRAEWSAPALRPRTRLRVRVGAPVTLATSSLHQPLQLGARGTPTRLVSLPHGQLSMPPKQLSRYYGELASNDVGLIVLGGSVVSAESFGARLNPLFDARFVHGLGRTADAIHEHGSLFVVQLLHLGAQMAAISRPFQPVYAPSSIPTTAESPSALTVDDIARIRREFCAAAARVAEVGADGFELHAAHNYLLHQFLSPGQNERTDAYGGDLRGRARLLTEIAGEIRQTHPEHVLGVRLSFGTVGRFGLSVAEAIELGEFLDQAGLADYLTVSVPSFPHLYVRDESFPPGGMRSVSRALKDRVTCAVNLTQRIDTTYLAEDVISSGDADLVGVARGLLADPSWGSRHRSAGAKARPCVRCMQGCRPDFNVPVTCDVNPSALASRPPVPELTDVVVRRAVVLGGGPAGCEAAVSLANRGVDVVLVDDHAELGGRARLAGTAPFRTTWKEYADYLDAWVRRDARIELRLGRTATAEEVCAFASDVIVAAVGARMLLDDAPVGAITTEELLDCPASGAGKRVLVVDHSGRWDAINAVEVLCASADAVVYVTTRERVGDSIPAQSRASMRRRLRDLENLSLVVAGQVSWDGGPARIEGLGDPLPPEPREYDLTVWSGPLRANAIDEAITSLGVPVWRIGDGLAPRGLGPATREGFAVGDRVAAQHAGTSLA